MTVVLGGATNNPVIVSTYTLPATTTGSKSTIKSNAPVVITTTSTAGQLVTIGDVTTSSDNPGMSVVQIKTQLTPEQTTALRSATSNTAAAYNLPVTIAADQATNLQKSTFQADLIRPSTVIDYVIVPP